MAHHTPIPASLRGLFSAIGLACVLAACSTPIHPASEPSSGSLFVSVTADRKATFALDNAVVDGQVFVFFFPPAALDVAEVRFFLDDPYQVEPPMHTESSPPFDLAGGSEIEANAFDTATLANGAHVLVAEWLTSSGARGRFEAGFTIANDPDPGNPPPDKPPADPPTDPPTAPPTEPPSDPPVDPDDPPTGQPLEGTLFVALTGDDAATGSASDPFATIQKAVDAARPGDVILIREGVYRPVGPIRITGSGTAASPVVLAAFPGETVAIDGTNMQVVKPMIRLTASHWRLQGLEIRAGPSFGLLLMDAEHNVLDRLETHHNGHSGIHLGEGASYNLIVDCSSHDNFDPASGGENADGFAIKHRTAVGNTVLRSAAWNNSDDGFDLLDSPPQRIDRSVAYRNGLRANGVPYPNGNGNGFKLGIGAGRYEPGGGHLVTRSVAWGNEVWGFNSNNGTIPITLYNNTAWGNGEYDFFLHKAAHVLVNNLSYAGKNWTGAEVLGEHNSWQLNLRSSPFVSTDPTDARFLWLTPEGSAVDKGRDVGLEYAGAAPDLGAIEEGDRTVTVGLGAILAPDTSANAN